MASEATFDSIWETVWECSLDGEISSTLSIAKREGHPPSFSLMVRRVVSSKGYNSFLPLNRSEALWLANNLKSSQSSGYVTTSSNGDILRKIEVTAMNSNGFVYYEIESKRLGRRDLKMYIASGKLDAFIEMLNDAVEQFVKLS